MDKSLLFLTMNNARHAKLLVQDYIEQHYPEGQHVPMNLLANISPKGNTQVELKVKLQCSKQEVSRLIQKASEDGWVTVATSPEDKRAKRVMLSEQGLLLLQKGKDVYANIEKMIEHEIGAEAFKQLTEASNKLNETLKGLTAKGPDS